MTRQARTRLALVATEAWALLLHMLHDGVANAETLGRGVALVRSGVR